MERRYRKVACDPDVYLVSVPFPGNSFFPTNCYLMQGADEWLLVDVGMSSEQVSSLYEGVFRDLGVERERLSIFLTHLHLDHAEALSSFGGFGGAVYVSEAEYLQAQHPSSMACLDLFASEGFVPGEQADAAALIEQFDLFDITDQPTVFVGDGDVISVGPFSLVVLSTPGHTQGHLSLYHPGAHLLFGGDLILYKTTPNIELFADGGDSLQAYFGSLDKVKALGSFRLFPGHGEPRDDALVRIEEIVGQHERRLRELVDVIGRAEEPLLGIEAISSLNWRTGARSWDEVHVGQKLIIMRSGVALLDHLIASDAVVRRVSPDGLRRYELQAT